MAGILKNLVSFYLPMYEEVIGLKLHIMQHYSVFLIYPNNFTLFFYLSKLEALQILSCYFPSDGSCGNTNESRYCTRKNY